MIPLTISVFGSRFQLQSNKFLFSIGVIELNKYILLGYVGVLIDNGFSKKPVTAKSLFHRFLASNFELIY